MRDSHSMHCQSQCARALALTTHHLDPRHSLTLAATNDFSFYDLMDFKLRQRGDCINHLVDYVG